MERYGPALDSLRAYLEAVPAALDRDDVQRHVVALRQILSSLN
jgi:hypothetical protein